MKIQVLGPRARNAAVIEFFERRGDAVSVREDLPAINDLESWGADYLISNGFAPIISEPLISAYVGRILNVHPAYLPHGRGIYPNFWCLLLGDPIGVTVHLIDSGIDTGPILSRKEIDVAEDDTLESLYRRLLSAAESLLFEIWGDFVDGGISSREQDERDNEGFYHSRVESELVLDLLPLGWATPVERIKEMGVEILANAEFWAAYEEEISRQS